MGNQLNWRVQLAVSLVILIIIVYSINTMKQGEFSILTRHFKQRGPLEKFRRIHSDVINGRTPVRVTFSGYTNCGYGNKVYGLLSSFVVAILTDSALIIRWHHVEEFFEEPLKSSFSASYFETFPTSDLNPKYKPANLFKLKPKQGWLVHKNLSALLNTSLPLNSTRFYYSDIMAYFFEICSNPTYYEKLASYSLVDADTVNKTVQALNDKGASEDFKLNSVLQVGYEVGGNILNKMWIPKLNLRERIDVYFRQQFKDFYVIGIQLRFRYLDSKKDTLAFIKCAMLIEHEVKSKIGEDTFFSYYKGFKWFFSSDNDRLLHQTVSQYRDKSIVTNETIGHVDRDVNAYPRTIIDIELLSRCDQLIMTGGSTFGFIAAMKSQRTPYYVNGRANMKHCRLHEHSYPSHTLSQNAVF